MLFAIFLLIVFSCRFRDLFFKTYCSIYSFAQLKYTQKTMLRINERTDDYQDKKKSNSTGLSSEALWNEKLEQQETETATKH